jgi:hypothetical protein
MTTDKIKGKAEAPMETAELDVEQRTGAEAVEAESADELNVRDLEGKYQRARADHL